MAAPASIKTTITSVGCGTLGCHWTVKPDAADWTYRDALEAHDEHREQSGHTWYTLGLTRTPEPIEGD